MFLSQTCDFLMSQRTLKPLFFLAIKVILPRKANYQECRHKIFFLKKIPQKNKTLRFNPLMTEAVIIYKPVN